VTTGEQCDDRNTVNTDACTNVCQTAVCGDGIRCQGAGCPAVEACDDGSDNQVAPGSCPYNAGAAANSTCNRCSTSCAALTPLVPRCGDGTAQLPDETCDDGNATCGTCSANCQTFSSAKATGTILVVGGDTLLDDTDLFVLDDGFHRPVQFEYKIGSGIIEVDSVPIIVLDTDSANTIRTKTLTAINSVGSLERCETDGEICSVDADCALAVLGVCENDPTTTCLTPAGCDPGEACLRRCVPIDFDIAATAGIGDTEIKLTNARFSTTGNVVVGATHNENVNDVEFALSPMTGGTGGDCADGQACRANADCESEKCTGNVCVP
jgi:cysteine-rich repeat protein